MLKGPEERFAQAQGMIEMISDMIDGAVLVDKDARIVWSNDRHVWFVDKAASAAFGGSLAQGVGLPIERVIPHSRMREVVETGRSIPLDIMAYGEHTLLVSRLPLRDENGQVIGAVAFALKNSLTYLRPIAERVDKMQSRLARMERDLAASRTSKYTAENLVGFSPAMVQVKRLVRKAGLINSAVLLLGETGTGKELAAHSIHAASDRVAGPFVGLNVAAIPENLLEAELFGVAPGAYTGAGRQPRMGKFQLANGGTLFLDEIGDMPLAVQAKLLRVLQECEVEPLGSNQMIKVDIRVVAATSRPLPDMVKNGEFRADLYYRLNVFPIHMPALRDRKEDLENLAALFSERTALSLDQPMRELTASAIEALKRHDWPGNVRELANVIEQVYARTDGECVVAEDFADILPDFPQDGRNADKPAKLSDALDALERSLILDALDRTGGNKLEAARKLGLSRTNLYAKLHKHGIA